MVRAVLMVRVMQSGDSLIHAVFSTKQRQPYLSSEIRAELFPYLAGSISRMKGKPVMVNGPRDHVHILFSLPPVLSLSDAMEKLKAKSSKWVHQRWRLRSASGALGTVMRSHLRFTLKLLDPLHYLGARKARAVSCTLKLISVRFRSRIDRKRADCCIESISSFPIKP